MIQHPTVTPADAEETNTRRNFALDLLDNSTTPSPPASMSERKAHDRPGFVFYKNWQDFFEELNDQQVRLLMMSIFRYVNEGQQPDPSTFENLGAFGRYGFRVISRQIDSDSQKYAETCRKNAENGKKGGRPKNTK